METGGLLITSAESNLTRLIQASIQIWIHIIGIKTAEQFVSINRRILRNLCNGVQLGVKRTPPNDKVVLIPEAQTVQYL